MKNAYMKNYVFASAFAPYIEGLLRQKRANGFSYTVGEYFLKKFDQFCVTYYPESKSVDRDLAAAWAEIRPTEGNSYRNRRVEQLRQLCLYMCSLGLEAYVPRVMSREPKPVLYIPSREETAAFFAELDTWICHNKKDERAAEKHKMIFRLYYCCGLRLSEARLLKREHVDFDKGVLTILQSKGPKDRLVYLPPDGTRMLYEYNRKMKRHFPDSPWLFPGQNPMEPLTGPAIQRRFNECWNRLPFAGSTDKEPSPHCLRHAFVVERMNDWMAQGIDLQAMLPHLSHYLGHKSPAETFYYYHLVDRAFAVVREKDTVSARVIPEVQVYEEC